MEGAAVKYMEGAAVKYWNSYLYRLPRDSGNLFDKRIGYHILSLYYIIPIMSLYFGYYYY